jgi:Tol biopolymer transport system component
MTSKPKPQYGVVSTALCILASGTVCSAEVATPQTVLTWHGHRMFEDISARSEVSPDGKYVLRTFVDGNQALLRLPDGSDDEKTLAGGVANFEKAAWCGNELLRVGTQGAERHWFTSSAGVSTVLPTVPPDAMAVCSADGKLLAHFTSYPARRELPPPKSVFLGTRQKQAEIKLDGVVMSAHFSPDGRVLYALVRQDDGASALLSVKVDTHQIEQLAKDLDSWPYPGPELTVTPDGKALIVPLATNRHPIDAQRQVPNVPERWLKLFRLDVATRTLTLLHSVDHSDETDPAIVGSTLYWVSGHNKKQVLALPVGGGAMHVVATGSEQYLPSWTPDGKRIAYVTGDYRLADWALTQDIGIVAVDDQARAVGPPKSFIVGNHEDFPPDWSRDGRWIAWHSHRANKDPAYYDAPGTTDDIWVRRAEDVHAKEIRATHDLWETGWAYWSRDGRELLYTSWDRNGTPGIYQARIGTFDPDKGVLTGERRFPMPSQVHSPQIAIWSPSGTEIAVEDAVSPTDQTIWIVSLDGRHATKVVQYHSETYGGLDWTPDGSTLIYAGLNSDGTRMQIFSVARTGGTPKQLSDGAGNYLNPRLSPDGRWIAFSEVDTTETLQKSTLP